MVAPKTQKRTLLNGLNPLSYQGVEPSSPSDFVTDVRDPISGTSRDYQGFDVGDEWLNRTTLDVFKLVSKDGGVATWVKMVAAAGDVKTLKDDAGTVIFPAVDGAIKIAGGELIDTTASANTLTVNLDRGLDGQIPIAATGAPTLYANIIPGAGIGIVNSANGITITGAGFGGDVTLVGDGGTTATTVAGSVNVVGTAGHVTTTGNMGQTLTLDLPLALTHLNSITNANSAFALNTGTGALSLSNDALATTVNIASGAGSKTLNLGSTTTTSATNIKYGTNDFNLTSASGNSISALDTGEVTTPRNPTCFANVNAELNVSGNGTVFSLGSVAAMTEVYDIGNHFFPGNGAGLPATYTIPVDGTYNFTWDLSAHIDATGGTGMRWYLSDGGNGYGMISLPTANRVPNFSGASGYIILPSSITKFFTAGTVLTLVFVSEGGAKVDEIEAGSWSGCLIG